MNSEERLKKHLEDLLASKKFPFDKANWERAQRLMASEEAFKTTLEDSLNSKDFPFDEKNWEKAQALMTDEAVFKTALEDSLSSKEFAFDEKNWEKAAGMIYASDRSRRVALYVVSGILLFCTLLTSLYLYNTYSAPETSPVAIHAKTIKPLKNKPLQTPSLNSYPEPVEIKNNPEPDKALITSIKAKVPFDSKAIEKPAPVKPSFQKVTLPSVPKTTTHAVGGESVSGLPVSVLPDNEEVKDRKSAQPKELTNNDLAQTSSVASAKLTEDEPKENNSEIVAAANTIEKADKEAVNVQMDEVPSTPLSINTKLDTPLENKESENNGDENFVSDMKVPTSQSTPEEESVAINDASETTQKDKEVENAKSTNIISDSLLATELREELPPDVNQGELGRPKDYPVLFSVEAGADYLYGWKNPVMRDANSFNFVFGINYFSNIKPKMDLSIGIHYVSVSDLSYSKYTSRVTRLGFGEESTVTVFTPTKLHYVLIPMRFNYNLTPLNTIGIGYNLGYLLTVDSEIETYTEKLNAKSNQELSKGRGYTEGFKKYDSQVSVFYRRRLYPNLAINMEAFLGLTDIKDDKFFNSKVFERNSGLKLTLVYNFLRN